MTSSSKTYILLFCLIAGVVKGQERKILGRVLDRETKKPITNAHVIIHGTGKGTASNAGGFFELSIEANSLFLTVSHIGFKTTQIPIPVENKFMFYLDRERTMLPVLHLEDYPKAPSAVKTPTQSEVSGGFQVVEELAVYPGGMDQFYEFIGNALAKSISKAPASQVDITFTIAPDGHAVDIAVSDSASLSLFNVANAFKGMPAWTPASQRDEKVPQYFLLPVTAARSAASRSSGLMYHVSRSIQYPLEARRMGIEGPVVTKFTVTNGVLTVSELLNDIGAGCGVEVVRALSETPEAMLRPMGNGTFILPVHFGLETNFEGGFKPTVTDEILLPTMYVTAMSARQDKRVGSTTMSKPEPTKKTEFSDLDQALQYSGQVESLKLINQGLEDIPDEIRRLTKLKKLDLEGNKLTILSSGALTLSSLRELYLFNNHFTEVPPGISWFSNLIVLGLARNAITEVSEELTHAKKLEALDLSDNRIAVLPASLSKLKRLRVLNLKGNMIRNLPPEFYTLPALEKLDLTGNPLDPGLIDFIRSKLHGTVVFFE